jgi:hypothetical protein
MHPNRGNERSSGRSLTSAPTPTLHATSTNAAIAGARMAKPSEAEMGMDSLHTRRLRSTAGQGLSEYIILLALVSCLVLAAMLAFHKSIFTRFNSATRGLQEADCSTNSSSPCGAAGSSGGSTGSGSGGGTPSSGGSGSSGSSGATGGSSGSSGGGSDAGGTDAGSPAGGTDGSPNQSGGGGGGTTPRIKPTTP